LTKINGLQRDHILLPNKYPLENCHYLLRSCFMKKRFILLKQSKASQVNTMPVHKALFVDVDGVGAVGGASCADA